MQTSQSATPLQRQTHHTLKTPAKGMLMSVRDLQAETGRSRQWIYDKLRNDPSFPKPLKTGGHSIAWLRTEFESWVFSLPRYVPTGVSAVDRRKLAKAEVAPQ
ncbi:MAG: helix-turn-helix transcriptional regulator [Methylomonas sp.]